MDSSTHFSEKKAVSFFPRCLTRAIKLRACVLFIFCFSFGFVVSAQEKEISGMVTDNDGVPLPGVNITVKGASKGTSTDFNGQYEINAQQGEVLKFSSVGFKDQTQVIGSENVIDVIMKEGSQLDKVIIVGYGTQERSSMTGSVSSVSTEDLQQDVSSPHLSSSLQGTVPGVNIVQPAGIAGESADIVIRGAGTLGTTDPLYVIDGAFANSLDNLNSNDVESMEVLKDAAASAIYGSRAANGVILVKTKKGRAGSPTINFDASYSFQTPAKKLNFLNANEYRRFANRVADNSGISHAPENDNPSLPGIDTDWQNKWFKDIAPMSRLHISMDGGSENATYYTSLGYTDQEGIVTYSGFKRYDLRLNSSFKKGIVTVDEAFSLSQQDKKPTANQITIGLPTVPYYDDEGNYTSGSTDYYLGGAVVSNPIAPLHYNDRKENRTLLTGSLNIGADILPGLKYKLKLGGNYEKSRDFTHQREFYTLFTEKGEGISSYGNDLNSIKERRGERFNYSIENTLNYKKRISNHNFDILVGTSWLKNYYRYNTINNIGDLGSKDITGTGGTVNGRIDAFEQKSSLLSYFGRLNYDFDKKYLFSATIRNDISSKFGKGYRSGWFPSVSAGWNIHKEKWFDSETISNLKLRGSYGKLGANFIDPYQFEDILFGPIASPFGMTLTSSNFAYVAQFHPDDLSWETATSRELGLELGLLDNKITFSSNYFYRKNEDLLVLINPTPSSGQSLVQGILNESALVPINSPKVRNTGFEFEFHYKKERGDFKFNVSANLTTLRNKVLTLGENVQPILGPVMSGDIGDNITITRKGDPIGSFYGFEADGLTDEGKIRINGYDENGNEVQKSIGNAGDDDKKIIGNPYPDFTYGIRFSGEYKKFDLSLFFQGSQGADIFNQQKYHQYFDYSRGLNKNVLNSWTPSNTDTDIPQANTGMSTESGRPSTFYVEDGSYLRLKNLQIGYNFEESDPFTDYLDKLRIYIGMKNLFTITSYSGYDPEVGGKSIQERKVNPTTKTKNVDLSAFPNSRTFTIGMQVQF